MWSFFNRPFPSLYKQKEKLVSAILFGLFVSVFLITFQPFGISTSEDYWILLKVAAFGPITFFVMAFVYLLIPKIYPKFYREKNYTIGKDLIVNTAVTLLIGIANSVYAQYIFIEPSSQSVITMIVQTFLIGIIPLSFLTLIQYSRLMKSNTEASLEINLTPNRSEDMGKNLAETNFFSIKTDQGKIMLALKDLLFLESDGNYVYLHEFKNGEYLKTMHRVTLKSLESENNNPGVIRCHRSYIVNLDQVIDVGGNAQGLKLTLNNTEETIPVSRKHIAVIKSYLNSTK